MIPQALEQAAKTLLATVISEGRWDTDIEALMSSMPVLGGGIARIAPPMMFAIPSSGVGEQFGAMKAGKTPTLTPLTSMRPKAEDGFIADHVVIPAHVRRADVFYQEFLRPRGCVYKTSAFLDQTAAGSVDALIYRTERQGPFEEAELKSLNLLLPYLRSAAMVARGALEGKARTQAEPFEQRGEPLVSLDARGRIMALSHEAEVARGDLFDVVGGRIVPVTSADQPRLDRGLRQACEAARPALVTLTRFSGDGRVMALMVPIQGHARDVFRAVSVLVAFITVDRPTQRDTFALDLLREAGHLTRRELDVARLIGQGQRPSAIAEPLGMSEATVRVHLRSATAKLGVHGQAELAALLRRLC